MLTIDLKDKVAVVTGVSSGIGAGVAGVLAEAGCNVMGCGTSSPESKGPRDFLSDVKKKGSRGFYMTVDVTKENEIRDFVDQTVQRFGRIDILISNAGMNVFHEARECSTQQFDFNTDLNLKSHWLITKYCFQYLKASRDALVVIMTSNHAYSTIPGCFPYNVTKAGLVGMVNALAIEWGPEIRVVGLAPGFIETKGGDEWFESFPDPKLKKQNTIDKHPVKRLGSVEEIGGMCAFLASSYARFITGTTYLIDGGRSALLQDS